MSKRVWLTWETQPRNKELAQAFGCDYGHIVREGVGGVRRYIYGAVDTFVYLLKGRYQTLFVQCPSVVLCLLVSLYATVTRKVFVIDCHNIVLDQAGVGGVTRKVVSFIFRQADYVIVSNSALVPRVKRLGGVPLVLPDKLPMVKGGSLPPAYSDCKAPLITFVCSFASDEPIDEFISAALLVEFDFTLFVTGKRSSAEKLGLLKYESDKVIFTDYLKKRDYDALIASSDILVVLTTRDDCLVCGAYEALSISTPAILSDTQVLRECFPSAFYYTKNTQEDFQATLEVALGSEDYKNRKGRLEIDKLRFEEEWVKIFSEINQEIEGV